MKRTCGLWFAVYLLLAAAIGAIVYRRFPMIGPAFGAAVIGGGVAWMGVAYFAGILQKLRTARMIRRGLNGDPPLDGQKYAAIGRISPQGSVLASPLSHSSCVAYKYEIRSGLSDDDITYYDGFALTPSVIQARTRSIRLLAWGDFKQPLKTIPASEAKSNAGEYIAKTEFRKPTVLNFRQSIADMKAIYRDDDGSVRWDQRGLQPPLNTGDPIDLDTAAYRELVLRPGEPVCVIGRYSAQRGGIVPSDQPIADPVTIEVGEPEAFAPRAAAGAAGYFIGGVIFLGIVLIAFVAFHAAIPLEAAEQMAPKMVASWPEIRFERMLDRRVRPLMRQAGMLSSGEVLIQLPPGSANGRVKGRGESEVVSRAAAQRAGDTTVITIDDGKVVLTIDEQRRPLHLTILGQDVPATDADIRIGEENNDVTGRITYLPEGASEPACRVTFCAQR